MRLVLAALLLVFGALALPTPLAAGEDAPVVHGSKWVPADLPELHRRMDAAAKAQRFEEAARFRDLIHQVEVEGATVWYEGRGHMNRVLFTVGGWTVTGWKILGYLGTLMFGGRWFIQAWYRKRTGKAQMPTAFWIISLISATMVTMYFIWGKNDSVGIISNALPASVALYNLFQDLKLLRQKRLA